MRFHFAMCCASLVARPAEPNRVAPTEARTQETRQAPEREVADALRRLADPRAGERAAAERWLAARLGSRDFAALAELAQGAPAEVRLRLEAALGSDALHFDLIALLLADSAQPVRALGEAALTRLASSWLSPQGLEPDPMLRVLGALAERDAAQFRLRIEPQGFARTVERVVRLAGADFKRRPGRDRVDVVVDPLLAARQLDARPIDGAPGPELVRELDVLSLLCDLSGMTGVEVEGFGLEGARERAVWLHLVPRELVGKRRADELVASWVREVSGARDLERRAAAARALAATGWDAPLAWLEARWRERADEAALDGMLLAAARGRVSPALQSPRAARELLTHVDAALAAGTPAAEAWAERLRAALEQLPARDMDGNDLCAVFAADFAAASERGRALRALVLSRFGAAFDGAPARDLRAQWRARLSDAGSQDGAVARWAYLAALAASPGPQPEARILEVARCEDLLRLARERGALELLIDRAVRARATPPSAWREPGGLPAALDLRERLAMARWWGACEVFDVAQRQLAALCREVAFVGAADVDLVEEVQEGLHALAVGPARAALERACAEAGEPGARLAALAGVLERTRHAALAEDLAAAEGAGSLGAWDLAAAGSLCAGPAAEAARALLVRQVGRRLSDSSLGRRDPWVAGVQRAWAEMCAADQDEAAESFRATLQPLLRRAQHPLAVDLARRLWPRPRGAAPMSLDALEDPL